MNAHELNLALQEVVVDRPRYERVSRGGNQQPKTEARGRFS